MNEWLGHFKTEWKQLLRGAYFWILLLVGGFHAWLVHSISQWTTHVGFYLQQFEFLYLGALAILAVLSGVYGARNYQIAGEAQLMASIPHRSIKRYSAHLAVYLIPFTIFTCIPVCIYLWKRALFFPDASLYPAWFLLSSLIPMFYSLALGWILGGLLKNRIGYFLGFLLFFLHIYGGMLLLTPQLPLSARLLPNFLLFDYQSMGYFINMFGFSRELSFWMHRGFYLSVACALFLFIVQTMARKRREPGTRAQRAALLVLCVVAVSFMTGHLWLKKVQDSGGVAIERYASSNQNLELEEPTLIYDLDMKPLWNGDILVRASIQFPEENTIDSLAFKLNETYNVIEVLANENPVPFTRNGKEVRLDLKNEHFSTVMIHYEGSPTDYKLTNNSTMSPMHFADKWNVNLPMGKEWFPLPLSVNGIPKRVTVHFPDTISLYSNYRIIKQTKANHVQSIEFESVNSYESGFNLWGGPLRETIVESGKTSTKVIANELVDPQYVEEITSLFQEGKNLVLYLRPQDKMNKLDTIIPVDWIHASSRDIKMTGEGFIEVPSYLLDGLYADGEIAQKITTFWADTYGLLNRQMESQNRERFIIALSAYLLKQVNKSVPVDSDEEALRALINQIQTNNEQQNLDLLKTLYEQL
ncbi:hypothetical protein M4D81_28020 [Paenibacillus sp. p3-SID867]|uniref:hypothetical protein n=1 Tax=Paenibacillus sp. p3-SID867 TaxID=2916363 RepID=UPI0021A6EC9F|nr:hypothetical protein [Paenibacillus sp. p3-SID867]MCT1402846.1 hypothetical protein [Paenibacillus sp. p3-SID867]